MAEDNKLDVLERIEKTISKIRLYIQARVLPRCKINILGSTECVFKSVPTLGKGTDSFHR